MMSYSLVEFEVSISKSLTNFEDTEMRASSGHGRNQSIAQPLKTVGNFWARSLNF
jgi:hypothetical protein